VSATFGILGDIHGNFTALDRALRRHPDVGVWLCVGDVASITGAYPAPAAPMYFIKGNNEDFDRLAAFHAGTERIENLHYIPNGVKIHAGGVSVAGVGGTFAPTWYDTPAAALPSKSKKDDKRRHFVREEVEACTRLGSVDVLLTHEAPKPFFIDLPSSTAPSKRWRRDVGKPAITEVATALRPKLHCFGHHHVHASFVRDGVPTVCVDRINRSYLLVDAATFEWTVHQTEAD
jgi:Icc-related predicted phosphoesterase